MTWNAIRTLLTCAALMVAVSGCALTEATVDVTYQPAMAATRIPDAESATVKVTIQDTRPSNRDRISVKKNGYGMEMASIRAKQDIPVLVQSAVERELSDRGFRIGDGPAFVLLDLNRFYADYKTGFFSAGVVADVQFNVQVRGPDGRMVYGKGVNGEGKLDNLMLMGGDNARDAVQKGLSEAVRALMTDAFFLQALKDAQRPVVADGTFRSPTS